jgi:hypothetical protein
MGEPAKRRATYQDVLAEPFEAFELERSGLCAT